VLALFIRQRPPLRSVISVCAAALVLGLIACFPYGYAWVKTGNPLFPFYNDFFKSPFFPAASLADLRWMGHMDSTFLYDITFASGRFLEADAGALGLSVIVLVPLA